MDKNDKMGGGANKCTAWALGKDIGHGHIIDWPATRSLKSFIVANGVDGDDDEA